MRPVRSLLCCVLLFFCAAPASAQHLPYALALVERTEGELNRSVIALIRSGDYGRLKEIIATRGDSDLPDRKGVRPIHCAAALGSAPAIALLAERGVNVKARTFGGWSALHYAAVSGHVAAAEALVQRGVMIDVGDAGGESPLFYAVESGHLPMVEWLIAHGAQVNHPSNKGQTPLAVAQGAGQVLIGEYLRMHGARLDDAS